MPPPTWGELADGRMGTEGEHGRDVEAALAARESGIVEAADLAADQIIAAGCEWASARREMLLAMAEALLAAGNGSVMVTKRGRPVLDGRRGAADGTSPADKRSCSLAKLESDAAREMADNLTLSRWLSDINARERRRRKSTQQRLTDIGRAIYGDEWISPLARDLQVALRTVQRWAAGEFEVPAWVFEREAPALCRRAVAAGVADVLERRATTIRAMAQASADTEMARM